MKPWKIALAYIAFSVLALALFATPLWYAWRVNVGTLRVFVPEDLRALTDLFHRKGADAVAAAVRSRADASGPEVIVFAGPGKEVLAGTLGRWPSEIPDAPGTYGHVIDRGDGSFMRIVVTHEFLPGGYQLIMGRQSAGLMSLEGYFWYGMAGAMAIVLSLGGVLAWLLARRAHAARLSEERYKRALQATNDGIWEWNPATDEIFLSERALHLWAVADGVPIRTRADLKRAGGFHPEDFQRTEDVIEALASGEGSFDMEHRVVHSDGQVRWVRSQGRVFPGLDDRPMLVTGSATDITERKLAEEALRRSEERYALAVAGSDEGIFDADFNTGRVFFSPRAAELTGLPLGTETTTVEEYLAGLPLHPDDIPRRRAALQAHLDGKAPAYEGEFRLRQRDGVYRWRRIHGLCVRDAEGRPYRMAGSISDVDARRQAAEALRESEERYEVAMAASESGYWDWHIPSGRYFLSPKAYELGGYPSGTTRADRDEFKARINMHPEDFAKWDTAREELFAGTGERLAMEVRYIVRGVTRWHALQAICRRDDTGNVVRWTGSATDITERKMAEEALRRSEERYALAVAGSDDGVWDVDFVNKRVFISERARELAAMPPGPEIVPMDEWFASLPLHPEDVPRRAGAFAEHIAGKTPAYIGEFRLRQTDGTYRWRRLRGLCLRDADGQPYRMAGSISDIDARRRAEDELRESEGRFRALTELWSDWYWVQDETLRFTYSSAAIDPPPGYLWGSAIGKTRWELEEVTPVSCTWDEHKAILAARQPFRDFEYSRPAPDGTVRYVSTSGVPIFDERGNFKGYQGTARNITERKRFEEALRLSEERYAVAMEVAEEGHWDWNVQTDEIFASAQSLRVLGVPEDGRYRTRSDIRARASYHPDDWPRITAEWREALAGSGTEHEFEYRIVRGEEPRWIRGRWKIFRDADGMAQRVIGVISDITERRLAEDALRRSEGALRLSEERYELAMRASGAGHWDWKIATDEFYVSPRYLEYGGFPPDTGYSRRDDIVRRIPFHPDDRGKYEAAVAAHFAGETPRVDMVIRVVPHGRMRWLHVIGMCSRDAEGKPVRWAGSVTDITARQLAEDARRFATEELGKSEARFRALTELSSDWYWAQDEHFRFVYMSDHAAALGGYTDGSSLGRTRWELEGLAPLSGSWTAHQALLAAQQPFRDLELRRVAPDGSINYLSISGAPTFDEQGRFNGYQGVGRNITERKRIEEDLRESESRFRSLTQISSDWYWRQDEDLRFTYLSEGVADRAGWPGEDYIGRLRWEVPGIHLSSCSWEEHKEVLAKRLPFRDLEYWRPGEDGPVYSSISGAPIFDEEGRFKGYQGVGRNITERKRVEDALRLSEARYARAMDASADGLWEWKAGTDELFISPRARELWGIPDGVEIRTRAELKARKLQFTEDTIRECIAQRSGVEMTYSVLNQAGELRWIRSMGKVFLDEHGEPMLVTGSLTDATEGKLAADALRHSEEELRARQDMLDLAQKAASAVAFEWHVGPGEGENGWSPDLEIMYGLEPGSYNGTFESWKKLVFPEDWPAVKAAIERASETGDVAADYRVVHPDGAVRWLQAKGRMFFDDARKPARVVGFMLDVTDRHQAEEELRRLERQLRQAQRLEAMGTLAGGIAHDFNNILGAILGYGEMAMRDAPKASRLARDLDSIIVAGERGRALVDRVLAFSRSGVGERIPVHVEKVVREALDLIRAKLPRNIALQAKLRAGRAAMLGDATQVHQVVMNLATNAVQAMQAGGRLRVSLTPVRLETARAPTIGIIDPGEYLVLEVADSGAGIAPEDLEHIFDPFFTTKEVGTGTGLGLSLVHGIVVELGGGIDVASTLGAGSTFTVYLPRSGETVEAPQDEEPEMPRGDGQRVLVVDDEEPLVRLATRTLEELGYAPVGFTSSSAALAAFRADPQHFDALITDERMPGLSGSALIREVRGIRSSLPVVLMSGYLNSRAGKTRGSGLPGAPDRASKVVVAIAPDEVLQKPLSARDLATSLAKVLRL